jgi:mono/diheme cytochrome c family protein
MSSNEVPGKRLAGMVALIALCACVAGTWALRAGAQGAAPAPDASASADAAPADAPPPPLPPGQMMPLERVKASPKGTLKNPYTDDNAEVVAQGNKLFLQYSCNGCHGGGGGGGICPPLINDVWVYGGDDDTLFRLISLGSIDLQANGYLRKGRENVVAPMPPFGPLIRSDDELWKILAFVRAHYNGSPSRKFGTPPAPPEPTDPNASNSADTPDPTQTSK